MGHYFLILTFGILSTKGTSTRVCFECASKVFTFLTFTGGYYINKNSPAVIATDSAEDL